MKIDTTDAAIELMIQRAAERGAEQALARIGLNDENSANDIRELRSLLDSWRTAKKGMISAAAKWLTVFVLGALAAGAAIKLKIGG